MERIYEVLKHITRNHKQHAVGSAITLDEREAASLPVRLKVEPPKPAPPAEADQPEAEGDEGDADPDPNTRRMRRK